MSIALPLENTASTLQDVRAQRNRANAQKSTGPRTAEGKRRSAQNARKHSLTADGVLTPNPRIPPDLKQDPDYEIRRKELREEFNPTTPAQHYLLDQIALVAWKLEQIPALERQLLATPLGSTMPADLTQHQHSPASDPTIELTAAHLLQNQPTPLTRLWDHHRRLQARFQSLIRQIRAIQRDYQHRRQQADKQDDARRDRDHDALTEMSNAIHDRNQQRRHEEQLARRHAADYRPPAQNEATPPAAPSPKSACGFADQPAPPDLVPAQNEPTAPPSTPQPPPAHAVQPAMQRNPLERIRTALLAGIALVVSLASSAAPPGPPASPEELFTPDRVHVIHLKVGAPQWKMMQPGNGGQVAKPKLGPPPDPSTGPATKPVYVEGAPRPGGPANRSYPYVRAAVEFDGQLLEDVGLRFKGNVSYTVSMTGPRRPMKLDFERFTPEGRFAGLAALNLNNAAFDPSEVREALGFALFAEMGVPAPRTSYALTYFTAAGTGHEREYLGLYTLIEEVDDRFLKRYFDRADGLLLKPEGVRGIAYLGEDWAAYDRFNPKGDYVDPKLARRVIELARLIKFGDDALFRQHVESYLAVDGFLRYVAVNAAIANLDSFLSTGHNYYLYVDPKDGRAHVIPWDLNLAFGGYTWVGSGKDQERLSITRPHVDRNRLIERLLAVKEYNDAYRGHLKKLAELMSPEATKRRQAALQPVFERARLAAREAGKENSPTTQPAIGLGLVGPEIWSFMEARSASIRLQLDGKQDAFVPGFNNPKLVPGNMRRAVGPGLALMKALDADRDELLTEAEAVAGMTKLLAAAGAPPDGAIDSPAARAALTKLLGDQPLPETWPAWLFKVTDTDGDNRVNVKEARALYQRLLPGVDRDYDDMICGREIVDAIASAGVP